MKARTRLIALCIAMAPVVALDVPVGTAAAEEPSAVNSVTVASQQLRVVNHNVAHSNAAVDTALAKAQAQTAPIVLLQEICESKALALADSNPSWSVVYRQDHNKCDLADGGTEPAGNVAIWRGGSSGTSDGKTFDTQIYLPQRQINSRSNVACVLYTVNAQKYRACSTHLIAASESTSVQQATELKDLIRNRGWIDNGAVVVVGGDFNMFPTAPGMDRLYKNGGGYGDFYEITRQGGGVVRAGAITTMPGNPVQNKIDYIFVSSNVFPANQSTIVDLSTNTSSDHKLFYGSGAINI